jgi:putative protein-disulfide isomerase
MQQPDPDSVRLFYVHDPMCSWCWAFEPCWQEIQQQLPQEVSIVRLLGGLAPDSSEPMAPQMQDFLQQTWKQIEHRVPGTPFNFEFWNRCSPRRSTYPACRAVIAARQQGAEVAMTLAIQHGYYLEARNPSDEATLVELAVEIGLDQALFIQDLGSTMTQQRLLQEIAQGRKLGAQGFPSLILEHAGQSELLALDYRDPQAMLRQIVQRLQG